MLIGALPDATRAAARLLLSLYLPKLLFWLLFLLLLLLLLLLFLLLLLLPLLLLVLLVFLFHCSTKITISIVKRTKDSLNPATRIKQDRRNRDQNSCDSFHHTYAAYSYPDPAFVVRGSGSKLCSCYVGPAFWGTLSSAKLRLQSRR